MSPKTLANWVKRAQDGELPPASSDAGAVRRSATEQEAELSRLRREVAELRMERDILKMYGSAVRSQPQHERWRTR